MARLSLRRLGALLCAGIAGVYVLIGAEVVTVAQESEEGGDIRVFGFGAAAIFLVGMALLLWTDRRPLLLAGAILQGFIIAMYVAVAAEREPAFEAWGVALRLPQLMLMGLLLYLALRPSEAQAERVVDPAVVEEFLAQRRFAVVGASDEATNFGGTIVSELRDHGYEVVAVHPTAPSVRGEPAFPSLDAVPEPVDGVIVMVPRDAAVQVVRDAVARGVPRVWLFKGAGAGAVSHEAIAVAREAGASVVPGACPLMFLSPVAAIHRIHRGARHLGGSLAKVG
jgi:uncharacterized protein